MIETPSSTRPSLQSNDTVGSYLVLRYLGGGNTGEVYEVEHVATRRRHALKILRLVEADLEPVQRLWLEARIEAQLTHENIVRCTDAGLADDGRPWLVMDLLRGPSGRQIVADGPVPMPLALDIGRQLAMGLSVAHRHGIIHRDVKPENYLVVRGVAKLVDFGLVQVGNFERGWHGTVSYMSPEQILGDDVDEHSDVYSVAMVMSELILGRPTRVCSRPRAVGQGRALCLVSDPVTSLADRIRGFPPYVAEILDRGLARNPQDRWTAAQLGEELKAAQARFAAEYPPDAFPTRDGVPVRTPDFRFDTPPLQLQGHCAWVDVARKQGLLGDSRKEERAPSAGYEVPEYSVSRPARADKQEAAEFARFDALVDQLFEEQGLARNDLDLWMAQDHVDPEPAEEESATPGLQDPSPNGDSEADLCAADRPGSGHAALSALVVPQRSSIPPSTQSDSLSDATPGWAIPATAFARTVESALLATPSRVVATTCGAGLAWVFDRPRRESVQLSIRSRPEVNEHRAPWGSTLDDGATLPDASPPPGCSAEEMSEAEAQMAEESGHIAVFAASELAQAAGSRALARPASWAVGERSKIGRCSSDGGRTPERTVVGQGRTLQPREDSTVPHGTLIACRRNDSVALAVRESESRIVAASLPADRGSTVVRRSAMDGAHGRREKNDDEVMCGIPVRSRGAWLLSGWAGEELSSLPAAERRRRGFRLAAPPVGRILSGDRLRQMAEAARRADVPQAPEQRLATVVPFPPVARQTRVWGTLASVSTIAVAAGLVLGVSLASMHQAASPRAAAIGSGNAGRVASTAPSSQVVVRTSEEPKLAAAPADARVAEAKVERSAAPPPSTGPVQSSGRSRPKPKQCSPGRHDASCLPLLDYHITDGNPKRQPAGPQQAAWPDAAFRRQF